MNKQHEEFEPRQNIVLCSKPSDRDLDPGAQREGLHSAGPILKEMLTWKHWWIKCGYQKSKEANGRQQREIENATVTRAMVVMSSCMSVHRPEKQKRQS